MCVCLLLWISLNKLFFPEAASSLCELGTWHDNWRPCNLCLKCQRYLCQRDFVWTHWRGGPRSLFETVCLVFALGILGGLSIVTMAMYLAPHPLRLLPGVFFGLSSCLYPLIQTHRCQKQSSGAKQPPSFPFQKKKKALYPNSIGPELDEAWERHVPLNSFDKATWASGEHFKHEGSLNTKLAAVALLQWAHLFACVTAP